MAPNNSLPIHGNEKTMNMNHLILTNIQASPYFKVNLYELKTYHEVIDEIYYKVSHLEPWEKGSRKTAGQTGMCGGVRGVGAGGIVSSAFCLLYKLFTLRLTRKQVIGLCTHNDSPYIRALGFMYIRYTQPPADFWDWYEEYLEDEEEIDVKAGGGHNITIGEMLRQWLIKLEWYSTLFPRIPVPVQKSLEQKLKAWEAEHGPALAAAAAGGGGGGAPGQAAAGDAPGRDNTADNRDDRGRRRDSPVSRRSPGDRRPTPPFDIAKMFEKDGGGGGGRSSRDRRSRSWDRRRSRSRDRHRRSRSRHRSRSRERKHRRSRSRSRDKKHKKHKRSRSRDRRSRSRESHRHKHKHRSRSRDRDSRRETSFERDLRKEKERQRKH